MCAANATCRDANCLETCRKNKEKSVEAKALLECSRAHHCDRVRGQAPDNVDSDVAAGHVRIAYPLVASQRVLAAVGGGGGNGGEGVERKGQGDTKAFYAALFSDLSIALGVSSKRFRRVRQEFDGEVEWQLLVLCR